MDPKDITGNRHNVCEIPEKLYKKMKAVGGRI